jgi:hypothetical protein
MSPLKKKRFKSEVNNTKNNIPLSDLKIVLKGTRETATKKIKNMPTNAKPAKLAA